MPGLGAEDRPEELRPARAQGPRKVAVRRMGRSDAGGNRRASSGASRAGVSQRRAVRGMHRVLSRRAGTRVAMVAMAANSRAATPEGCGIERCQSGPASRSSTRRPHCRRAAKTDEQCQCERQRSGTDPEREQENGTKDARRAPSERPSRGGVRRLNNSERAGSDADRQRGRRAKAANISTERGGKQPRPRHGVGQQALQRGHVEDARSGVHAANDIPQLGRDRGWIAVHAQSKVHRSVSTPLVRAPDARPLAEIDEHLRFGRFHRGRTAARRSRRRQSATGRGHARHTQSFRWGPRYQSPGAPAPGSSTRG